MNVLKITREQFFELERLRRQQASGLKNPVLCSCDKCNGFGFADKTAIKEDGYTVDGIFCPCGGHNRKVDKVEIIDSQKK